MPEPQQVIDAANQFAKFSMDAAGFAAQIIRTKGQPGSETDHHRAVEAAAAAARGADAAFAILFAAAKACGYDPTPLTDYQAHPNDQTRGTAAAFARRLLTRAEAEQAH